MRKVLSKLLSGCGCAAWWYWLQSITWICDAAMIMFMLCWFLEIIWVYIFGDVEGGSLWFGCDAHIYSTTCKNTSLWIWVHIQWRCRSVIWMWCWYLLHVITLYNKPVIRNVHVILKVWNYLTMCCGDAAACMPVLTSSNNLSLWGSHVNGYVTLSAWNNLSTVHILGDVEGLCNFDVMLIFTLLHVITRE